MRVSIRLGQRLDQGRPERVSQKDQLVQMRPWPLKVGILGIQDTSNFKLKTPNQIYKKYMQF